jgi:ankyrin repeat protein
MRDLNFHDEFAEEFIDQEIFPLALATMTGSVEMVKLLLSNEAIDINLQTKPQGLSALKIACTNGFYEIAELLVA